MALFVETEFAPPGTEEEWVKPTFKDCVAKDIDLTFFEESEHAEWHCVDGTKRLVIVDEESTRTHAAHWEAGGKQNFDTGLYDSHTILYIKMKDYGPKPKVGKRLVLDEDTDHKRTYSIVHCKEEDGVFRFTLERIRQ